MKKVAAVLLLLLSCKTAFALEDTPENRRKEMDRFLATSSVSESIINMANEMAKNQPPEQREVFKSVVTKYFDMEALTKIYKDAFLKTFTADELAFIADTGSTEMAKTVEKKMTVLMGQVAPDIQAEAMKAVAKAYRDLKDKDGGDEEE